MATKHITNCKKNLLYVGIKYINIKTKWKTLEIDEI